MVMETLSIQKIKLFLLLGILILTGASALAQVYPEKYLEQALQNNPKLQAQRKAYEAALQQTDISATLPDPQLTAGFFTPPMERFMGNQWLDVGVMQMFPWFGTLERQKSVAEKQAESSYHQFRAERNWLFMEMTRLWLDIFRKEQKLEILIKYEEILKDRENIIYTRYAGGQEGPGQVLDLYRLEIQLADFQNRKDKLQDERIALHESFNILIGQPATAAVETPELLPETPTEEIDGTPDAAYFGSNPQLNNLQLEREAREIQKEVSRLQTRPMLGIGLQYSYFAPGEAAMGQMDGGHMLMPMVSVSLPIFRNKNRAIQQQGALLAEAASFRESEQHNQLKTQWSALKASTSKLQRDNGFLHDQLDITQKTWELIITAYASGNEGFDDLLRIQDQLLDLEWRLLENTIDRQLIQAELDMLLARNIFE